jgi:NAD(P)-dependent dehydrogenase (short-subunit alcohol dehydrogenase family)
MINSKTVILVSGGARGITAQCVIELARRYQCRFILVGRSTVAEPEPVWAIDCFDEAGLKKRAFEAMQARDERPKPADIQQVVKAILARREILETLQIIRQAGGQAEYLSVDIGNTAALQQLLAPVVERLGPVTGLIHGAGVLADKPIEQKSIEDFERVYGVKVTGLQSLLACVPLNQLAYVILFSSAAGFFGNVGQTDYALANEILNKIAHQIKRKQPHCRVLSLNWGPWDGGMVTPALKRLFAQNDVEVIPIEAGTQFLADNLHMGNPETVQFVVGSPFIASGQKLTDTTLRTHRVRRTLTEAANPFLQDHRIGHHAVLPMVCGVAWVVNVAEQLYPGYQIFRLENFKVLKGIVFDDTLADAYFLDLKEIAKDEAEIIFEALIWSENDHGPVRYHYKTQLQLRRVLPEPDHNLMDYGSSQQAVVYAADDLYRTGMLFHGPSFRGVQRVLEISPERLVLEGCLPQISDAQQGQFPVQNFNPFVADVQFQSLVIWARHFYQAGSLPLSCQLGEQFKPLQFDETFYVVLDVQSSTNTNLVTNLSSYDRQGQLCNRLTGAQVTISQQLNPLFQRQ